MQAVIKISGGQYLVNSGDEILVNRLSPDGRPDSLSPQVLLLIDGDKVRVGQPTLSDVSVRVKVVGEIKGKKIRVSKFKAKSRYRRTAGFRPKLTRLKIENISAGPFEAKNQSEPASPVRKKTSRSKKVALAHP